MEAIQKCLHLWRDRGALLWPVKAKANHSYLPPNKHQGITWGLGKCDSKAIWAHRSPLSLRGGQSPRMQSLLNTV